LRFDVKFHNAFTYLIERKETVSLLEFFEIIDKKFNVEKLDFDMLKYAEIGSCDEYGDVYPFDFSDKNLDVSEKERLLKKIQNGDVQKPDLHNLLVPTVRPNLKKFVCINEDKKDIYFTKAFLCFRSKTTQLSTFLLGVSTANL
jgi:hypothetical protein